MKTKLHSFVIVLALFAGIHTAAAQGVGFTYQGRLDNAGGPANGTYDLTYKLWTLDSGGTQVGSTFTVPGTMITNGLFTATLDFGNVFNGSSYWLELGVRTNGAVLFQTLLPRQEVTPTPYAIAAENVLGLVPASQLSGALPAGLLTGTYSDPLNLNNVGNNFDGNGSGLTALNASQLSSGTVPDARLSANVALLNANQTFTGVNTFSGPGESLIINSGPISTSLFTGLSLQYYTSGEGAIMSSYDDGYGYLTFYTKQGFGYPIVKQMQIDKFGGVAIDQQNYNNGVLNDGTTNGVGITFGTTSGEGIASQRTAGIDQYTLEFYTAFVNRMIIMNNGFVGIGTTNPAAQLDVRGNVKMGATGQYFATGGAENLRIVRGIVQPTGSIFNGTGFTITHVSTGTYSITFSPAFADVPSLTITPYTASGPVTADCTGGVPSGFSTITIWVSGVKTDSWWNFSAIGGR
jgi:hypothetical protein